MNPRISDVQSLPGHLLKLTFSNGEQKIFDVKPYLLKGIFSQLADERIFNQVRPFNGSIIWPNDLDLCPDTLYEESLSINV